jgi:hypothetical protein
MRACRSLTAFTRDAENVSVGAVHAPGGKRPLVEDSAMKVYPLITLFVSLLVITPPRVMASCEGVEIETLLAAWYDPNSDIIIKRIGQQTAVDVDERYVVEKDGLEEMVRIMGAGTSMSATTSAKTTTTTVENSADVRVMISQSDTNHVPSDPQITSLVKNFRERAEAIVHNNEYRSTNEWKTTIVQFITQIDTVILEDKRFIPLTPQSNCPTCFEMI